MKELEVLREKEKLSRRHLENLKQIKQLCELDKKKSWEKIYFTLMDNEELTISQIKLITGYGQPETSRIRKDISDNQIRIGEPLKSEQIPTVLLLEYLGKTMSFYKKKFEEEIHFKKLKEGIK